jgi:hypothetical protein
MRFSYAPHTPSQYPPGVAVDVVRSAYESLGEGDPEPLVSLIHPEMEWRGRRRLSRLWSPPS